MAKLVTPTWAPNTSKPPYSICLRSNDGHSHERMQGAVEFPLPSQSRSDGTGVVDAETSSGTYTPFASSQTAVPELEPPFSFDSCKGARPDGTHVNHALVKEDGAGGIESLHHETQGLRRWRNLTTTLSTARIQGLITIPPLKDGLALQNKSGI